MGGGNSAEKQLAGAYREMADAYRDAAMIQAQSAQAAINAAQEQFDKSLEFLRHTYNVARNDLAPYRGQGFAATQELYELMGINPPIEIDQPPFNPDYPTKSEFINSIQGGYASLYGPYNYDVKSGQISGNSKATNGRGTYSDAEAMYYAQYPQAREDERKISRFIQPTDMGAFTQDQLDKLILGVNRYNELGTDPIKRMLLNAGLENNGMISQEVRDQANSLLLQQSAEKIYQRRPDLRNKPGVTVQLMNPEGPGRLQKNLLNLVNSKRLYDALEDKVGSTDWQDEIYNNPQLREAWKAIYGTDITPKPKSADELSANALKKLRESPGYQFAFKQGQDALENSAAARGMLGSGNTFKEITEYGQGMADQQYQQRIANLQQMIQTGQQSAAMAAQQNISQGQDQAAMRKNLGDTIGSGEMAKGNAIAHGLIGSKRWDIQADAAESRAKAGGISGGFGMMGNIMGMMGGGGGMGMQRGGHIYEGESHPVGETENLEDTKKLSHKKDKSKIPPTRLRRGQRIPVSNNY